VTEAREPEQVAVPVRGGELSVLRWRAAAGAPVAVLLHGITSNALVWARVAAAVAGEVELVAPDLRGRAGSARLPGPYGLAAHADDVAALLDRFGAAVLAGHSMGAFVATRAAAGSARYAVRGLVLVDGGLPFPEPPGADVGAKVAAMLGPTLARLDRTFPDLAAVRAFWAEHPAVGPWVDDPVVAAYLARDVVPVEGGVRSACVPEAIRTDGADVLANDRVLEAADDLPCPTTLLWATRGLQDQVPGLYDEVRVAGLGLELQGITAREVPGTNHYSIVWTPEGVAGIAAEVRAARRG
jgi:pimeloyl-ACP methyl ester carboxylesterase